MRNMMGTPLYNNHYYYHYYYYHKIGNDYDFSYYYYDYFRLISDDGFTVINFHFYYDGDLWSHLFNVFCLYCES